MMSRTSLRRILAMPAWLVIALLPDVAASAAEAATARVDRQEISAGATDLGFRFEVANAPAPAPAIDSVRILAPAVGGESLVALAGGSAPGWSASVEGNAVVFRGASIPPGWQAVFDVSADVSRPAVDRSGSWTVLASAGGSGTESALPPSTPEALATTVRVASASDLSLVSPQGTTDGSVTSGQSGVCARFALRNTGSRNIAISPQISGASVTVSGLRAASGVPCSGDPLPQAIQMAPSERIEIDAELSFGDPGSVVLLAGGEGPAVRAIPASRSVTVQKAPTLTYLDNSLEPRAVRPFMETTFRLAISKTAGTPGLTFDPSGTTFEFDGCAPKRIASPNAFGPGAVTQYWIFEPCAIGDTPAANHPVTLRYRHTDANGSTTSGTVAVTNPVRVDAHAPEADLSLQLPPSSVPGSSPAARNGRNIIVSGSVRDHDPDRGTVPCPRNYCSVSVRILSYEGSSCTDQLGPANPVTISYEEDGTYRGELSPTFPPGAGSMVATAAVADRAGFETLLASECIEVDNAPPTVADARVAVVDGQRLGVEVVFSERVGGTIAVTDWSVSNNVVLQGGPITCDLTACRTILRVAVPFPAGNPGATVRYQPAPVVGSARPFDKVGLELADQTVSIRS